MNLIDAVKSGKRYKRRGDVAWSDRGKLCFLTISYEYLVADDYEIEQEPREFWIEDSDGDELRAFVQRNGLGSILKFSGRKVPDLQKLIHVREVLE